MASPLKFKLKQVPTDVWSIREKLCLASSVMRSGDQNWVSVSRAIKSFGEPNRPADWFSQKNCALQYSELLEKVDTPKRKRGEREIETPGESIVKKLIQQRIEELQATIESQRQKYIKIKLEYEQVSSGQVDDKIQAIWQEILLDKKKEEEELEKHEKWIKDREAARQAALSSLKTGKTPVIPIAKQKRINRNVRQRQSGTHSDQSSESESIVDSPLEDVPTPAVTPTPTPTSTPTSTQNPIPLSIPTLPTTPKHEVTTLTETSSSLPKPTLPPTSPLLTSLLKNPSPSSNFPSLTPLISPTKTQSQLIPTTPVTTDTPAIVEKESQNSEDNPPPKPVHISPSAGAPTLSRLLELPWTSPGKPLPALPVASPEEEIMETQSNVESETPSIKSPLSAKSPVINEDEMTSEILETEDSAEDLGKVKPTNDVVGDSNDVVVVEKLDDCKTGPTEVELDIEVVDSVPVPGEIITYQEEEYVQTSIEIQEESEIEVVSITEPQVEEENIEVVPKEEEEEKEEPVLEIVEEVKVETEEVKTEEIVESENSSKVETTQEIPQVEEVTVEEVSEKKVEENTTVTSVSKSLESLKTNRGKRGRANRRSGSLRTSTQSSSSVSDEVEKTETQKEKEKPVEKIKTEDEAGSSEIKTPVRVKEEVEKEPQEKPSEEKVRGKKGGKVETKKKKETKESSDESSESKTTTRKRKIILTREQRWKERKTTESGRSKLRRQPSPEPLRPLRGRVKGKEELSLPTTSDDDDDKSSVGKSDQGVSGKNFLPTDSVPNSPSSLCQSDDPDSLRDYKLWKKAIMLVWRSAANHKYANVFLHPVTDDVAPGYSSVVYRSMDLSQIKKSIESGAIKTTSEFQRDMMLMFQNAIMYNSSDHDVYTMAVEMQKEVESHIQDFRATQLMVQTTEAPKNLRRETRELSQKRTSSEYRERTDDYKRLGLEDGSKVKKRRTRATDD